MTISSIKRKSGRSRKSRRRTPVRRSQNRNRTPVRRSQKRNRTPVRRSQNRHRTPVRRSQNRNRTPARRSNRRLGGGGAGAYIGAAATGAAGFAISKAFTSGNMGKLATIQFMLTHFKLNDDEKTNLKHLMTLLIETFNLTGTYISEQQMQKQLNNADLWEKYKSAKKFRNVTDVNMKEKDRGDEYTKFISFKIKDNDEGGEGEGEGEQIIHIFNLSERLRRLVEYVG